MTNFNFGFLEIEWSFFFHKLGLHDFSSNILLFHQEKTLPAHHHHCDNGQTGLFGGGWKIICGIIKELQLMIENMTYSSSKPRNQKVKIHEISGFQGSFSLKVRNECLSWMMKNGIPSVSFPNR